MFEVMQKTLREGAKCLSEKDQQKYTISVLLLLNQLNL